jgi:hypothetical protein
MGHASHIKRWPRQLVPTISPDLNDRPLPKDAAAMRDEIDHLRRLASVTTDARVLAAIQT